MAVSISYREIDIYSNDDGNLGTNWFGPRSSVAFWAPGTSTYWSGQFAVSSFSLGASLATGSTDVLNTSSGFGSDSLDLTSMLATTSSYSATDATVFNWSGNPATPGFGCDTFSMTTAGGSLTYFDTLTSSYWGEVRDYEASINLSGYTNGAAIGITNFQDTNIQAVGTAGAMASVLNVQSGTFDFSQAGYSLFDIATASDATQGSTQTYAFLAGTSGDAFEVQNGTQTTDYGGTRLTLNGSTSLLDFYDNGGSNLINLTLSQISSNIFLNGSTGGLATHGGDTMNFIGSINNTGGSYENQIEANIHSAGGDLIYLNTTGTGAANIVTDDTGGLALISGFQLGRDHLDMALTTPGHYSVGLLSNGAGADVFINGVSGSQGIIMANIRGAGSFASHLSTGMVSSVQHLYVH